MYPLPNRIPNPNTTSYRQFSTHNDTDIRNPKTTGPSSLLPFPPHHLPEIPPPHPEDIIRADRYRNVKHNIHPHQPEIPPPLTPKDIHPGQELIGRPHGVILTPRRRSGVSSASPPSGASAARGTRHTCSRRGGQRPSSRSASIGSTARGRASTRCPRSSR